MYVNPPLILVLPFSNDPSVDNDLTRSLHSITLVLAISPGSFTVTATAIQAPTQIHDEPDGDHTLRNGTRSTVDFVKASSVIAASPTLDMDWTIREILLMERAP